MVNILNNYMSKYLKFIKDYYIYFPLSIPLFLTTGPFIPDLIIFIFSFFFLFQRKNFIYFRNSFSLFFFFVCIYFIVCSLLSTDIIFSFESSLFFFRIGVFSLLILSILINFKKSIYNIFLLLTFIYIFTFIDLIIQLLFGFDLFLIPLNVNRPTAYFGDEEILGSYAARLIPLYFATHFYSVQNNYLKDKNLYFLIMLLIISFIICISMQRTAIFIFLASIAAIYIFTKPYRKTLNYFLLFILLLLICLTSLNEKFKNNVIGGFSNSLTFNLNKKENSQENNIILISKSHTVLMKLGIDMFQSKPIFGYGPKIYRVKCPEFIKKYNKNSYYKDIKCENHPHHFFIQLLAETGLIGFFIIFLYFLYSFLNLFKNYILIKNSRDEAKINILTYNNFLLVSFFITLFPLIPNGNFFNNWLMAIYSFPIGFYLFGLKELKKINHKIL